MKSALIFKVTCKTIIVNIKKLSVMNLYHFFKMHIKVKMEVFYINSNLFFFNGPVNKRQNLKYSLARDVTSLF